MIRLTLKILLLLLLVLLGLKITNRMFATRVFLEDTLKVFEKSDAPYQIMFFGSSHAYCSYDPRVFETELGVNSIVFSSGSQRLSTTNFIIKETLKTNKPELIVVDIFVNSIDTYASEKQFQFQMQALDHFPNNFEKMELMYTSFGVSALPKSISSTLRFHAKWTKLGFDDYSRKLSLAPRHDFYNGFKTTLTKFSDTVGEATLKIQNSINQDLPDSLTLEEKLGIDTLIETLRNTGANFIFVNAPSLISEMNPRYEEYTRLIKTYIENKGVSFLDINAKADSLGITRNHYRDPDHLNQRGALIVSTYLANYVKNKYPLSTAEFPKEHFNRYKHIKEKFANAPFYKSYDSLIVQENKIKGVAMYKAIGHKYEVLIALEDSIFKNLDIKFEYFVEGRAHTYLMSLDEQDMIEYDGKNFAIASILYEHKDIEDMVVLVGETEKNILTILDNKMVDNSYDTGRFLLYQQKNIKLKGNVIVEYLEIIKKRNKYVFKLKISDSIQYSKMNYNLAFHILPNKNEEYKVTQRNIDRKMFFDNTDKALLKGEDTLVATVSSTIENIKNIKIFLYNREGYKGVEGDILWIEGEKLNTSKSKNIN